MKKKTTYIWMGSIVAITVILLSVIYFFHLDDKSVNTAGPSLKAGQPKLGSYILGDMSNPLDKPMDATIVGSYIYVSDTNHQQVQAFDLSGKVAFKFGKKGTGDGEFQFPYGITGDKKGNVYVADLYNGKISVFTSKGKFEKYFTDDTKNTNFLASPAGLRIYNNKLYVTDIKSNSVRVYNMSGQKQLELTTASSKEDVLNAPNAVTVDDENNIYVSDSGNQRVVMYDKNGKFTRIINGSKDGKGDSKFVNPRGIGVLNGTLLMVDNMTHYVYGFDQNGKQKFQFGGIGSDDNQFYLPNGLFVDSSGKVLVTDTVNQRIAIYN